ncbi:MAG TPA: NAD(P)H-hydrate epimerase, partial [Candidatus Dormibacteraeota bacterium]|nr:NAD(P)H-hydrate epimerase [Candidatus Dormibacteraeota bacterium]
VSVTSQELVERFGSLRAADVAALDAAAGAAGVDTLQLMELAGLQVARGVWRRLGERPGRVAVVAGRGNNGGDGLVAARHLDAWGCAVTCAVVAETDERVRGAAARQLVAVRGIGLDVAVSVDTGALVARLRGADVAVDALLGTGLRDAPRGADARAIDALAAGAAFVVSVDVPSGLDATTGAAAGACVLAGATVTLTAMKAGLWTTAGRRRAGEILVGDIGMPAAAWRSAKLRAPSEVVGGALVPVPEATH